MAGESQFSLFGTPSPEEIRAAIGKAGLQEDIQLAQVPALRAPGVALGQAGRMFGNVIGNALGQEDPRISKARQMEQVQLVVRQKAKQSGIDFASHPDEYMKLAANALLEAGMTTEAYKVIQQIQARQATQSDINYKNNVGQSQLYDAQNAAAKNMITAEDVMSKIGYRQGMIALGKARVQVMRAAQETSKTNSLAAQATWDRWKLFEKLSEKLMTSANPGAPTLTQQEKEVYDRVSREFMPTIQQAVGAQLHSGGLGMPDMPGLDGAASEQVVDFGDL